MTFPLLRPPEQKRAALPLDAICSDGEFSGYATLFGKVDLGRDRVEKGAFSHSLKQRSVAGIRMLYQHDPCEPVGVWLDIREDVKGLHVRGRIVADTSRGAEVLSLMRAGAVDGLSIGFRTEKSRTDRNSGIRSILQVDLWEISIVTFPLLPQARIAQVKGHGQGQRNNSARPLPSVREFERWLTQNAGLSRSQARTTIAKGFAQLDCRRDAAIRLPTGLRACVDRVKAETQAIRTRNPNQ